MYYFVYASQDWLSDTVKERRPDQFTLYAIGYVFTAWLTSSKFKS